MTKPRKSSEEPGKSGAAKAHQSFCEVESTAAFRRAAKKLKLDDRQRLEVESLMRSAGESFGRPHRHAGLGLRELGGGIYECRYGLHLRLIFVKDGSTKPPTLVFDMIGNHDDVRRYLKR